MATTHEGVIRHMTCNCCGEYAGRFPQWWNRDTGYGICRPCVLKWYRGRGTPEAEITESMGHEGIHWANAEQWAEIEAAR